MMVRRRKAGGLGGLLTPSTLGNLLTPSGPQLGGLEGLEGLEGALAQMDARQLAALQTEVLPLLQSLPPAARLQVAQALLKLEL